MGNIPKTNATKLKRKLRKFLYIKFQNFWGMSIQIHNKKKQHKKLLFITTFYKVFLFCVCVCVCVFSFLLILNFLKVLCESVRNKIKCTVYYFFFKYFILIFKKRNKIYLCIKYLWWKFLLFIAYIIKICCFFICDQLNLQYIKINLLHILIQIHILILWFRINYLVWFSLHIFSVLFCNSFEVDSLKRSFLFSGNTYPFFI